MLINHFEDFEKFLINQIQNRKKYISSILPNNAGIHLHDFNKITEKYSNAFFIKTLNNLRDWKTKSINEPFETFIFGFICFNTIDNQKNHGKNREDFKYLLKNLDLKSKDNNGWTVLETLSYYTTNHSTGKILYENNFDLIEILALLNNYKSEQEEMNKAINDSLWLMHKAVNSIDLQIQPSTSGHKPSTLNSLKI